MLGIFHIMGSDPNVFLLFRFLCIKFHASQPTVRSLPAAHHEEVCKVSSGVGSYPRSQYITISSSFTDVFLPSSLHNGYYSPRSEGKENRISLKLPVDSVAILNSGYSRGFPRYSVFVSLPFEAHSTWPSYAFLFPGLRTDLRSF